MARTALAKQQNTYQRFKKFFEENHDYALAGQFHFREMQLRELLDKSWINRLILRCYRGLSHYGENYIRAFFSWFIGTFGYPLVIACVHVVDTPLKLWQTFKHICSYYFSAIFPRALNHALGLYDDLDKQSSLQYVAIEKLDLNSGDWLVGSMVVYYVFFILLSTLFIMALRRSFRRR